MFTSGITKMIYSDPIITADKHRVTKGYKHRNQINIIVKTSVQFFNVPGFKTFQYIPVPELNIQPPTMR